MGKIKFVVAINREYGSGGSEIAYKLGKLLGVNVYDRGILDSLTQLRLRHQRVAFLDRLSGEFLSC